MSSIIAASGQQLALPSWGRSFWQDPNGGELICLYASGTTEVNYIRSTDDGVTWSDPVFAFPVDDFSTHDNFDTAMDRDGNVHCVHRFNSSGCYTILGKLPAGNWAPSGVIAKGFFAVRATVAARDFNGAIDIYDTPLGFGFADPTSPPTAQIVAVDSTDTVGTWYIDTPFTAWPTFRASASVAVGPSGGYPIPHNAGSAGVGSSGAFGALVNVAQTGIHFISFAFGATTPTLENVVEIDPTGLFKNSGFIGDVSFGPNMAWDRPHIDRLIPVLTSVGNPNPEAFELYTTANEPFTGSGSAFFGRVDSIQAPDGTRRLNKGNLPFKDFVNDIAGGDQKVAGGVPVEVSHFDEFATSYFYFQQRRENGDQTIFRVKANLEASTSEVPNSRTVYTFANISHPVSGIVSWADASLRSTGAGGDGLINIPHWQGFKVTRHPVSSDIGVSKKEIIATIGSGITNGSPEGIAKLYMWRFDDSLTANNQLTIPTYTLDYTSRSGTLLTELRTNGMTDADNFFDGNVATSGFALNGDQLTLEFSKALTFNRIEFVWQPTAQTVNFIDVTVSSSFDDITYTQVFNIPTGVCPPLTKVSAENDIPRDSTITFDMDGFAGRYVRINFAGGGAIPIDMREIRLYGGHATAGFIATSGLETSFEFSTPINFTETFNNAPTGLPVGWRTYGDFNWFVDNGIIQSGLFIGQTVGSGDSFAIRTDKNTGPSTSGILEVDVNISTPRTVSFDVRFDFNSNIGAISNIDPQDDIVEVFVITPSGTVKIDEATLYANQFLSPTNYYTVDVPINIPGLNTIRWIYSRGNITIGSGPRPNAEGAMWLDNIRGLDPQVPLGTIYGYMDSRVVEDETIYAYTEASEKEDTFSFGWMNTTESALVNLVNAYHHGETDSSGTVNAYLPALKEFDDIAGYIEGFLDTAIVSVGGYLLNSGSFDFLFGHMQNRLNESINGYLLAPSGAFSSINGYVVTPEILVINGYLKTEEEDSVFVNAYLKANGIGNQVNGFIIASGLPNSSINSYIRSDGALDSINGYMITGDDTSVVGYIQGASEISGVINAWISGVGAIAESVNGYIPGISGVASGNINSFISAVEVPSSNLNGYIIGYTTDDSECGFPLSQLPSVTIPTGNFFN